MHASASKSIVFSSQLCQLGWKPQVYSWQALHVQTLLHMLVTGERPWWSALQWPSTTQANKPVWNSFPTVNGELWLYRSILVSSRIAHWQADGKTFWNDLVEQEGKHWQNQTECSRLCSVLMQNRAGFFLWMAWECVLWCQVKLDTVRMVFTDCLQQVRCNRL